MMRPYLRRLLLLAGLFAGSTGAAETVAPAPFLWQVQGPKAAHYLLGSVHLLPQSAYPLPPAYDRAYEEADGLVFETDIAALSDPKTQLRMFNESIAPGGLKAQIGPELYQRVQDYAVAKDLPPQVCDSFKAWFCALTLEILAFVDSEFRPDLGIDQHFHARARNARKALLWLEEPELQMKLFTTMPDAVGAQLLASTLEAGSTDIGTPEELLRVWRGNDVAALEQLAVQFKERQPELYERLLAARNRAWMPRLGTLFAGAGTQLVIVGAAHLHGPDGLIALLKARGLRVTPVPAAQSAEPADAR